MPSLLPDLRSYRTLIVAVTGYMAILGLAWISRNGALSDALVTSLAWSLCVMGGAHAVRSSVESLVTPASVRASQMGAEKDPPT